MKRKSPWGLAGTGAVALLVLAGLLLLLANLYVQSQSFQERLRAELSAALRMPVEVRKTTFTPWEGLRIDGIRATPAGEGSEDVQISAESFRARLALWPLLSQRQVIVRDVLCDQPALAWTQTETGGWRWPGGRSATEPEPDAPADAVPETTAAPADPAATVAPGAPKPEKVSRAKALALVVQDIRIRHGRIELRDRKGNSVVRGEDVNADGNLDAIDQGRGTLWLKRAAWGAAGGGADGVLSVDDFRSLFTYDGETLRVARGHGKLAAGDLHLDGSLHPREPGTPFQTRGELENVSFAALLHRAGLHFDLAAGQVAGNFDFSGLAAEQSTHVGSGHLRVAGGELHGVPLLSSIGEALGIEDLRRLKLDDAHLDCSLTGSDLRIEPLVLATRNLRVDATGNAHLDRAGSREPNALDVQARLTLNHNITRQLPQFVENNFTVIPGSLEGARFLDFHVSGPLNGPRTDLVERALGKTSLRGVLEDFFGGDKPKDKKKKANK